MVVGIKEGHEASSGKLQAMVPGRRNSGILLLGNDHVVVFAGKFPDRGHGSVGRTVVHEDQFIPALVQPGGMERSQAWPYHILHLVYGDDERNKYAGTLCHLAKPLKIRVVNSSMVCSRT